MLLKRVSAPLPALAELPRGAFQLVLAAYIDSKNPKTCLHIRVAVRPATQNVCSVSLRVSLMKTSTHLTIVLMGLMLLPGCLGRRKAGTEALENELRHQEHKIWTYTSYIEDYQRLLDDCRAENKRLREGMGDSGDSDSSRPSRPSRDNDSETDSDLQIPQIEIPMINTSMPEPNRLDDSSTDDQASDRQASTRLRDDSVIDEGTQSVVRAPKNVTESEASIRDFDEQVLAEEDLAIEDDLRNADPHIIETVELNKLFTGGDNTDGVPGDEGISLLIETRNAQGEVIPPEGSMDVSLMDPSASSAAGARLGLWRLSADEVRERFQSSSVGKGVQLRFPWQHGQPRRENLRLFVRFTPEVGKRLRTEREIRIELPGRSAAERRRRHLLTARNTRRRFQSEQTASGSRAAAQKKSSAPLWDGGASSPSATKTSPTDSVLTESSREETSTSADSGWSQSERGVPTRPTPKELAQQQPAKRPAAPTAKSKPKEPPMAATRTPVAKQRPATSQQSVAKEPKIAIQEPGASAAATPPSSARPDRTTRKPRPWSPYR